MRAAAIFLALCLGVGAAPTRADDDDPPRSNLPDDDHERSRQTHAPRCRADGRTGERVRVLLMDLKAPPSEKRLASVLGQVIAEEAARVPGFQLLSTDELRALLANEADKAMAGCTDSECLADLASALDAELLISGALVYRNGEAPTISLSLVNTQALVTVNRVSMTWPGDPDLLPEVARAAAQKLVFEGSMRKPGRLVFEGLPLEAVVVANDNDLTDDLDQDTLVLPVGPYRILLTAEDHETEEFDVLVRAGKETVVDGTMFEVEDNSTTWWILAGAGAAAIVAVGGAAALIFFSGGAPVNATAQVDLPTLAGAGSAP